MTNDMLSHFGMELDTLWPLLPQPTSAEGALCARARLSAGGAHRDPSVGPAGSNLRPAQEPGHSSEEPGNQNR